MCFRKDKINSGLFLWFILEYVASPALFNKEAQIFREGFFLLGFFFFLLFFFFFLISLWFVIALKL